jgi:hypothetical protein
MNVQETFDPEATYTCRICKGPLPAGMITPANFEWHAARGTDCSEECHEERVEMMVKIKRRAKEQRERAAEGSWGL